MPLPLLPDNEDAGEATAGAAPDVFGATDRVRVVRARVRLVTVPPRAPKMLRSSVTLRSSWWRFSRPKVDVEEFRRIPGAWEASEWREFWLIYKRNQCKIKIYPDSKKEKNNKHYRRLKDWIVSLLWSRKKKKRSLWCTPRRVTGDVPLAPFSAPPSIEF